jgi:hypothetical protein
MSGENETIEFEVDEETWQLMKEGKMTWYGRLFDLEDQKILRLAQGVWKPGTFNHRHPSFLPAERLLQFLNAGTGEVLQFRYGGTRFTGWAQGWIFLQLGRLVEVFDPDGVPQSLENRADKMEQEIDQNADREEAEKESWQ